MANTAEDIGFKWANMIGTSAYSQYTRFDHSRVFSYETCIGRIAIKKGGGRVYLFAKQVQSKTTTRHKNRFVAAVPEGYEVREVVNPEEIIEGEFVG